MRATLAFIFLRNSGEFFSILEKSVRTEFLETLEGRFLPPRKIVMSSDSDCSLQEIQASLTKLTQQFLEMTQRLNEMNTTMKTLMGQLKTFTELTDGSNASDESEDDSGMGTTEFMTLLLSCI